MSHITKTLFPIPLRDMDALISAARILGATALKNADARGWHGALTKGEVVLVHPESDYDVAVNKQAKGDLYELSADLYSGSVSKVYGTPAHPYGKLIALYGAEVCRKAALLRGCKVTQSINEATGEVVQRVVFPHAI